MNKIPFLTTLADGQTGRYPLSLETLDFLQAQTHLVAKLAETLGREVFVTRPSSTADGLVVIAGELMPVRRSPLLVRGGREYNWSTGDIDFARLYGLKIVQETHNITADGTIYTGARIERWAEVAKHGADTTSQYIEDIPLARDLASTLAVLSSSLTEATTTLRSLGTRLTTLEDRVRTGRPEGYDELVAQVEGIRRSDISQEEKIQNLEQRVMLLEARGNTHLL